MTEDEMKANIQNGIAWLEENRPGWKLKVQVYIQADKFNMIMPCNCVIGATDGNFNDIFPNWGYTSDEVQPPIDLGFSLPFIEDEDEADIEYAKLTQLWIEAIS